MNAATETHTRILVRPDFRLSRAEFERIRVLVREHTGIALSEAKKELVYGRLTRRLRALKLASFGECRWLPRS